MHLVQRLAAHVDVKATEERPWFGHLEVATILGNYASAYRARDIRASHLSLQARLRPTLPLVTRMFSLGLYQLGGI